MDAHEPRKREKIKIRIKKKKPFKLLAKPIILVCLVLLMVMFAGYFAYEILSLKPAVKWQEVSAKEGEYIQLPKDDAPHNTPMEWWYYNGYLKTASGKEYSFHYSVFLTSGLTPHSVSHVSLADHQLQKNYTTESRTAGGGSDSGGQDKFLFNHSGWLMSGANGTDQLKINSDQFAFDLKLKTSRPPILHGNNGIFTMKNAGDSYYYSRSRLNISGTLKIHGNSETVTGTAWFDHQWGDFSTAQLSWDWFSLQLDNNSDIMIYQLRDKSNRPILYTGSITENGKTEILMSSDFSLNKGKKWVSNKTGISYPVEWQIKIPAKNIAVTTRSILNDSEFDATLTTYNIYWEGAVQVTGTHTGQGFMELSGYGNSKN